MTATILITRPKAAGERFAAALAARVGGVKTVISPVTDIVFSKNTPDLNGIDGLIFTSQNGVQALIQLTNVRDIACYCVGEKTAQAARDAGFQVNVTAENAEELVRTLSGAEGIGLLLHIRGKFARGDVAERLTAAGRTTRDFVLYEQRQLPLSDAARSLLEGAEIVIVPLFSPRSALQFASQYNGQARIWIAAMSDAVAKEAGPVRAERCVVATAPTMAAMVVSVAGLIDAEERLEEDNSAQ